MQPKWQTIGRLAEAAGVNLETVRYYERIGLMPAPDRTTGGHRVYLPDHQRRLTFIRRARELGFGIDDVRMLLGLAEPAQRGCEDVKAVAGAHLEQVRAKIADLVRLESILADTVSRCSATSSAPTCAVLKMLEVG
jgi:MerR family mercuric resistance operon transcriptional regulator